MVEERAAPHNEGMKLTKPGQNGASQLIRSVLRARRGAWAANGAGLLDQPSSAHGATLAVRPDEPPLGLATHSLEFEDDFGPNVLRPE